MLANDPVCLYRLNSRGRNRRPRIHFSTEIFATTASIGERHDPIDAQAPRSLVDVGPLIGVRQYGHLTDASVPLNVVCPPQLRQTTSFSPTNCGPVRPPLA